ncbi:MAG TPA: redoxin family protein [Candidatus Paceibacterota bacterium]|nr:redoxin family protein [Verrucomicrobiota bacterium]HSA11528.1 redoxin family protein [Candidatus Paceibacterota bacterium]
MKRIRSLLLNRVTLHAVTAAVVACCCLAEAAETTTPARSLHFPPDRSLGMLYMLDETIQRKIKDYHHWIDGTDMKWEYLGEASGEVAVPAGKRVRLALGQTTGSNVAALSQLHPDALYDLRLDEDAAEACLPHVTSLTGLRVLRFPRSHTADGKMPFFSPRALKQLAALKSLELLEAPDQLTDAGLAALVEALPQLKRLHLARNQLTDAGLLALPRLAALEELSIGGGRISNSGLAVLAKQPRLHYLSLWGDFLNDGALLQVRKIASLKTFVPTESITDAGLAHLTGHAGLEVLDLCNTKVTDRGVEYLKSLPSLRAVNLRKRDFDRKNPPITDAATVHLKAIPSLEQVSLCADGLTDEGVINLSQLPRLKRLELPMPQWNDPKSYLSPYTEKSIKELARVRSLEELGLAGPGVTDAAMTHLAQLVNLRSLNLFGCPVSDEGLAKLTALKALEDLTMMGDSDVTIGGLNKLNSLDRLTNLRVHSLGQAGAPLQIGGLSQLEYLMIFTEKGSTFRDADLACLAGLKRLKWLQMGAGQGITDAGMAHLAGLTALDRLVFGGSGLTDRSLAVLANMPRLDLVTINGSFTDDGLRHLEGLKGLRHLTIRSAGNFSSAARQRLRSNLPNIYAFALDQDRAVGSTATASAHPKPGTLAPDFTVTTLDGANFTLSKQRGKVVLLHFWATWCTPCVKGLPAMKTFHDHIKRKYGDRVVLLDLAMDDSEPKLRNVVATHKLTTPQARIGQGSKLAASYGVTGAPDDLMIGPDGRILLNQESPEGPGDTERVIDQALGLAAKELKPATQAARPMAVRRPVVGRK